PMLIGGERPARVIVRHACPFRFRDRAERTVHLARRKAAHLREDRRLVGVARDAETAGKADVRPVLAQDRKPERMEGVYGNLPCASRQELREPLAHLVCGAPREGNGKAVRGGYTALCNKVRDTVSEGARLARAGAGDDQERACGFRGLALGVVEQCKDTACILPLSHVPLEGGGRRRRRRVGVILRRRSFLWARLRFLPRHRRAEQHPARALRKLAVLEQMDLAVLA